MFYDSTRSANFDPAVWGPHYWMFLHTVAYSYPVYPNEVTKRKYYDLIHNMPLFIPNEKVGNEFSRMLDQYPVTPYLDKKESFVRWMNFIHNKINVLLEKDEMSLANAESAYFARYDNRVSTLSSISWNPDYVVYINIAVIVCMSACAYLSVRR
jgi:hypothetical protein